MLSTARNIYLKYLIEKLKITSLFGFLCLIACKNIEFQSIQSQSYKVQQVHDGDTLTVISATQLHKIRLYGIDCPEWGQPYSKRAKNRVKELVADKSIKIKILDRDRYGRGVAKVFLPDGKDLAVILVSEGLARWYKKYAAGRVDLKKAEIAARKANLGIWSINARAPWEYRKQNTSKVPPYAGRL